MSAEGHHNPEKASSNPTDKKRQVRPTYQVTRNLPRILPSKDPLLPPWGWVALQTADALPFSRSLGKEAREM